MAEHFRALFVVLALSLPLFAVERKYFADAMGEDAFSRFRRLWIGLTLAAFISSDFWVFAIAGGLWIVVNTRGISAHAALFPGLVLCLPPFDKDIGGFGLVNHLFSLSSQRLLVLAILLPLAVQAMRTEPSLAAKWPDRFFIVYLGVRLALSFREPSATAAIREMFLLLIDIGLPYYVLSRSVQTIESLRRAMAAILLAVLVMAVVAIFESGRHWLLYESLRGAWGIKATITNYLAREGRLRVQATAGHAISLGYCAMVGIGMYLYMRSRFQPSWGRRLAGLLLAGVLVVPLSRGPWVGTIAMLCGFIAAGPRVGQRLIQFLLACIACIAILTVLPGGGKVLDLLPFIGTVEKGSITYRQELFNRSVELLYQFPLFGPPNYIQRLANMGLVQGQGIVDLVNTYVQVAMASGMAGLSSFVALFTFLILGSYRAAANARKQDDESSRELDLMGRALLGTLIGMMVTIGTASSIGPIPWLYWSMAGMTVAYLGLASQNQRHSEEAADRLAGHSMRSKVLGWSLENKNRGPGPQVSEP